jgi:lipopolysaccharide export system permease protein
VPLGIKAQRKESSIGMAIAIATALIYYLIIILMMSLEKVPAAHPETFIWLPVAVCIGIASWLIPKNL